MNKKTRKLFAWCLVVAMLITQMLFTNIAFAATDSYKGNDRFSTAFSIVDKGWTTSDVAVIARGDVDGSDLADALAAAPLAYANGKAPVFITQKDVLTDGIMQRLTALGVKKVFIVGGTGAVSQAVEDTLVAKLGAANVQRVSGASRVETSLAVAKLVAPTPTKVVLVNGYASADALSAAPLAAAQGMPVLFVENKDTLSDAVKAYIGTARVYVVGGTGVVSDAVKTAVSGERVAGDDRFATNNAVLTTFAPDYTKVYLAKGADANAIDALAGAPLAALTNSPIVFVDDQGSVISAKASLVKNLLANSTIIGLGGLVTSDVLAFVDALRPAAVNVDSVSKITVSVNNAINSTYSDTVFLGALGQIAAKAVDKNGNPVANVPIVFQGTEVTIADGDLGGSANFVEPVAYTNADGIAIGFVKSVDNLGIAQEITGNAMTLKYEASVVGKNVAAVEGKIRFASLSVGTVSVTGPKKDVNGDGTKELIITPRVNAPLGYTVPMTTHNMNGVDTKYVANQQVSATGTTDNAITFSVNPTMEYVGDGASKTVGPYTQDLSSEPKLGPYHPYADLKSKDYEVPTGLKYATIYLKNLQLDEHARLYVNFYDASGDAIGEPVVIEGTINDEDRAIQIPQSIIDDVASFNVELKAPGQVNTTLNGGVQLDKVTGVFKTGAGIGDTKDVAIPGAKINWTAADVVYSQTKNMTVPTAASYGIVVNNAVKYQYKVPVFPFTGDAVVTAYDNNSKVLAYYLIPTKNVDNENVLRTDINAVLSSKDEVTNTVGTVTPNTDGTSVTVNSEKIGSTLVKGVIDIPGVPDEVLDATNATVYTSVNWAPLPKASDDEETAANPNLFALLGQKVNVVAQLVDRNGNQATVNGEQVTLSFDTVHSSTIGISGPLSQNTNSLGQVKWVLSSSALAYVKDLTAENDDYDVVLSIGSAEVTKADLYWVGAQLTHQPTLDEDPMYADEYADYVAAGNQSNYSVGTPVEFGFQAEGTVLQLDKHGDPVPVDSVTIANLPVDSTKLSGTVGTASDVADIPYAFLAKSDKAGLEIVDTKIGTITDGVTVSYVIGDADAVDGTFVGAGTSSIYNKYRMPITWESEGSQFNFVVPQGNLADLGTPVQLYVKLTDTLGNVLPGQDVEFAVTNPAGVTTTSTVTSNANGLAPLTVAAAMEGQYTVRAEYNGEAQYYSINVIANDKDFGLVSAGVNNTGSNDVVTLTFSNDLNAESVVARLFTLRNHTTGAVYAIKSAEVNANQVKLTLADSNAHLYNQTATQYDVVYAPFTEFSGENAGVTFNLTDVDGNLVEGGLNIVTFTTPSNVSVQNVALAGNSLTVSFYNGGNLPVYAVDTNGHVVAGTLAAGTATLTVDGTAQSFTVYCNGESYTFFN